MNAVRMMCAAVAFTLVASAPATAQMSNDSMAKGSMMSGDKKMMKMSAADKKMMTRCQGMDHDMMMKDKGCMKMMKMHPDMMKGHM